MSTLINFCDKIKSLPSQGSMIFATSNKKIEVCDSVITIIKNNINIDNTLQCIDFFCGHGHISKYIKETYNSDLIGIDINEFEDWNEFNDVKFFKKDVFEVIKLDPQFKFDIVVTFNTLRASIDAWGSKRHTEFLSWCSKHSKYLITNNCTDKKFDNFELIDTIQIPDFFDTNLFKSTLN